MTKTWKLIHKERESMADTLAELTQEQWKQPSLCDGWSVREAAGHIVTGAEQTPRRSWATWSPTASDSTR